MYRYNGKELDEATGLHLAMFRSYDPSLGRWLQVDPLADLAPGWTPYRNAFNNPLVYVDPLGLFETRREARKFRRKNGMRGRIKREKDAAGDKSFVLTQRESGDQYYYGAYAGQIPTNLASASERPLDRLTSFEPTENVWSRLENGGLLGNILYSAASGVNVLVRKTFQPRGAPIRTLSGDCIPKGGNEALAASIEGLTTVTPLPLPKGSC